MIVQRFVLIGIILALSASTASSQSAHWPRIYIDPGHGGPNADMTHNGDGAGGCEGPGGTAEQWINLKVALVLRDSLLARDFDEYYDFRMSRVTDTTTKTLRLRVIEANSWVGGGPQLAVGSDRIAPVAL